MAKGKYEESSIRVLKGLQPVRERPGMYTRTTDPTHIIQEAIDNAADEALAGQATRIDVRVHADGSVTVEDDGRGIPVGPHPEEKVPTVEVVFTRLHAGGKFDKKDGQGAYAFSGGLHGVGVSVTNALSRRLEVEVKRDGKVHRIVFADGDVAEKLKVIGTCGQRASGTTVRAYPDPKYFDSPTVSLPDLERLLRAKAVLLPGVKVTLAVEKGKDWKTQTWSYPGGLTEYLRGAGRRHGAGRADLRRRDLSRQAEGRRHVRRRRRRGVGARVVRRGRGDGRELRQPHPDVRRRHARSGPARRAVRSGEGVRRPSRPAAARRAAADRGRLGEDALRACPRASSIRSSRGR